MSKLLLSALALALLVAPLVQAQGAPAYTVTVAIEDLPASAVSNGTTMVIPFNVHAEVSGASPCLAAASSGTAFTITLTAELVNSTGNRTTVSVNPREHTIAGPVLLPITGGQAVRDSPATLTINAGPYVGDALNATVKVTATFEGSNGGCTGVDAAEASSDEKTLAANFEPVDQPYGAPLEDGQELPGLGLGALLVALAAIALIARRN